MTSSLRVGASPAARRSGDVDPVIASLPVSLHPVSEAPDLCAVAGESGWTGEALDILGTGIRGILVVDPVSEDASDLAAAASAAGIPVVIDRPLAGNPTVPVIATHFANAGEPHGLLECRVVQSGSGDLDRALLDQLALVRAAAAEVQSATVLARTNHCYAIQGYLANGRRTQLTGICTAAQPRSGHLRLLGLTGSVELTVPDPSTARPAQATITTPDGLVLLPTIFESAHRATWRRLRDLVEARLPAPDLDDFRKDVELLKAMADGP